VGIGEEKAEPDFEENLGEGMEQNEMDVSCSFSLLDNGVALYRTRLAAT